MFAPPLWRTQLTSCGQKEGTERSSVKPCSGAQAPLGRLIRNIKFGGAGYLNPWAPSLQTKPTMLLKLSNRANFVLFGAPEL